MGIYGKWNSQTISWEYNGVQFHGDLWACSVNNADVIVKPTLLW